MPDSIYPNRPLAGRSIRPLALGTAGWSFTEGVTDERILDTSAAALEHGSILFDTSLAYTTPGAPANSDRLVGEVLRRGGRDVVVSAKGGHYRDASGFPKDGRPEAIRRHLEVSLHEMGVDAVDVYSLHHVDPNVPIEDSVGAIDELRREGKVHNVGVSNVSVEQLQAASAVTRIATVQNRLSPYVRTSLDVLAEIERQGALLLAYSPTQPAKDTPAALTEAVEEIAAERGLSRQQVALAWILGLSDAVVPIVGSTRRATLQDSFGALDLVLTDEERGRIDQAA
jgi:aryl-alcohol dehydrogenase-like predicted oxidoreductase